jgi:hypothetical protein
LPRQRSSLPFESASIIESPLLESRWIAMTNWIVPR